MARCGLNLGRTGMKVGLDSFPGTAESTAWPARGCKLLGSEDGSVRQGVGFSLQLKSDS